MIGLIRKVLGSESAAARDARTIYDHLMRQSRQAAFFGAQALPDTQIARLELLFLHITAVMKALGEHGEQGHLLSQALFDTMREDFDIALREEGYTDSGVKRRIKPMIQRFYADLASLTEALDVGPDAVAAALAVDLDDISREHLAALGHYAVAFSESLRGLSLGQIATAKFGFPAFPDRG